MSLATLYRSITSLLFTLIVILGFVYPELSQAKEFVYMGLNNKTIAIYERNLADGSLSEAGSLEITDTPFYMERHPSLKILYVGLRGPEHGIAAYDMNPETGALSFINKVAVESGPVHISLDKTERTIFTSPYSVSSVTISPVTEEGLLVDDITVLATDEKPHAMQTDITGQYVYIITLGSDKIHHYIFDAETRALTPADPPFIATEPGAGPRLFAAHSNGIYMYLAMELDNTVVSYIVDDESGTLIPFQSLSTLPEGVSGGSSLSEAHLTPDNNFLYIANRGHNTIAGYSVNQESGELTYIDNFDSKSSVRSFSISSDGRHLYAGNRGTNVIEVFIIDDETGDLVLDTEIPAGGDPVMTLVVDNE